MKGAYCLLVKIPDRIVVRVGALGDLPFTKGYYIYVGSAMNSIEKRVKRHLRERKLVHWHIDYLLKEEGVFVEKVFIKKSDNREECQVARRIKGHGKGVKGFGCSDCDCTSHLFKVEDYSFVKSFMEEFK